MAGGCAGNLLVIYGKDVLLVWEKKQIVYHLKDEISSQLHAYQLRISVQLEKRRNHSVIHQNWHCAHVHRISCRWLLFQTHGAEFGGIDLAYNLLEQFRRC